MSEDNNNSDKKNRRDFLTVATTAVGAVGVGASGGAMRSVREVGISSPAAG